ncbi:MAG: PorV/PorQ family protein [Elusimicrobia bacterium]|nr:PorV/PorQ family protein [Elusimicrobiota bacterium]
MREFLWVLCYLWIAPMALSAADFLNVGYGARAVALGEAYVSLSEGPESLHWNPAGLAQSARPSVLLQGAPQAKGQVNDLGMAWPAGERGGWGTSLRVAGAGEVDKTDEAGNDLGTFEPRALALSVGSGRTMFADRGEGAAWGVGAQYVRSTLVDTAETMAFNAGLLSPSFASGRGRAGVAYFGGGRLTYDQESDPFPSLWRAGASYRLKEFWLIAADAGLPQRERSFLGVGTEFRIAATGGVIFYERAGYNTRWRDGLGGPAGFAFGLGAHWGRATLDYAFRFQGGWDAHILSLSMAWGSPGRSSEVRGLLREGHRLISKNRPYEAILKFNEALSIDPANEDAQRAIRSAADALRTAP